LPPDCLIQLDPEIHKDMLITIFGVVVTLYDQEMTKELFGGKKFQQARNSFNHRYDAPTSKSELDDLFRIRDGNSDNDVVDFPVNYIRLTKVGTGLPHRKGVRSNGKDLVMVLLSLFHFSHCVEPFF